MLASSTVLTWCRVDVMAESYTMSSWSGGGGGDATAYRIRRSQSVKEVPLPRHGSFVAFRGGGLSFFQFFSTLLND